MKKLLVILLLILPLFGYSQGVVEQEEATPCVQNIELAQQRYDEGRIQDIQQLLATCVRNNEYDKAQKSQALRLLTLSYIYLEDEEKAEETMLELLQTNHEFQVNSSIDPTEFINLHNRFRYKPLFSVGFKYIASISQPMITGINSSFNMNGNRPEYALNKQINPISFGVNFEYEFAPNFVLYPELQYRIMRVVSTTSQGFITNPTASPALTITNRENQNWFSIPVSVKYNFNFAGTPNLKVYANLGASFDLLLSANKPGDQSTLETDGAPVVGFSINSIEDRNKVNFGAIGGAGVSLKLGEGFITLEGRYHYSFTQLTNAEKALNPTDPAQLNTGVQDDNYRLNHIAISLGYTLNIYIPKKLR